MNTIIAPTKVAAVANEFLELGDREDISMPTILRVN